MTLTSRESLLTTLLVEYLVRARRPSPALVRALLAAGARAAGPDAAGRPRGRRLAAALAGAARAAG
ncbi:hypothetical protein [Orf virus]|nr:hypothetical protein [Orf virus]